MSRTCRVGIHGRNDVNFYEPDFQVIRDAKIEVVKMMSLTPPGVFDRIKKENPNIEIITRLHDDRINAGGHPSPSEFAARAIPVMNSLKNYCQKFQIANEPNHMHRYEGWGKENADAQNFNQWFLEVYDLLKSACPWSSIGFPGLAVPDFGHCDHAWLDICRPAIQKADWLGVHCYWQSPPGKDSVIFNESFGLTFKYYHAKYPDKVLEILECGNSNVQNNYPISVDAVANEYASWLQEVFKYDYINSTAFFLLSSPDRKNWDFFSWRTEDGHIKPVVRRVGEMARPQLVPISRTTEPLPQPVPVPTPRQDPRPVVTPTPQPSSKQRYLNQTIINALSSVAKNLGLDNWDLLKKSGVNLDELLQNRNGFYTGPAVDQMTLSENEKNLVNQKLAEIVPDMSGLEGNFTNQNLIEAFNSAAAKQNLSDPWALLSKADLSLGSLVGNRNVVYSGIPINLIPGLESDDKRLVIAELKSIVSPEAEVSFGLTVDTVAFLKSRPELGNIPLAPPKSEWLALANAKNSLENRVATTWNRYGWLLTILSDTLNIDLATAIALVTAEVTSRGLNRDGQMPIRFEINAFFDKWGKQNPDQFAQYFKFDQARPWQGHQWRPAPDQTWLDCHENQNDEWSLFEVAHSLDNSAAKLSLVMGATQIPGCVYATLGYVSVAEMFDAFASSELCQLVGLFDLIAGPNATSRQIVALQMKDFDTFATLHYSPNQAFKYAGILRDMAEAFRNYELRITNQLRIKN